MIITNESTRQMLLYGLCGIKEEYRFKVEVRRVSELYAGFLFKVESRRVSELYAECL